MGDLVSAKHAGVPCCFTEFLFAGQSIFSLSGVEWGKGGGDAAVGSCWLNACARKMRRRRMMGGKDGRSWVCCAYYGRIWEFKISRVVETGSSDSVGICGNERMGGAKDCGGDELQYHELVLGIFF